MTVAASHRPLDVGQTNWGGPLLRAVANADERSRKVFSGANYREMVHRLCREARTLGIPDLWGASSTGDRLVGAMLFADRALRIWVPGDWVPVLLVDGCAVGTTGVTLCASHVRSLGAQRVSALLVDAPVDERPTADLLEEIRVVRHPRQTVSTVTDGVRQGTKRPLRHPLVVRA